METPCAAVQRYLSKFTTSNEELVRCLSAVSSSAAAKRGSSCEVTDMLRNIRGVLQQQQADADDLRSSFLLPGDTFTFNTSNSGDRNDSPAASNEHASWQRMTLMRIRTHLRKRVDNFVGVSCSPILEVLQQDIKNIDYHLNRLPEDGGDYELDESVHRNFELHGKLADRSSPQPERDHALLAGCSAALPCPSESSQPSPRLPTPAAAIHPTPVVEQTGVGACGVDTNADGSLSGWFPVHHESIDVVKPNSNLEHLLRKILQGPVQPFSELKSPTQPAAHPSFTATANDSPAMVNPSFAAAASDSPAIVNPSFAAAASESPAMMNPSPSQPSPSQPSPAAEGDTPTADAQQPAKSAACPVQSPVLSDRYHSTGVSASFTTPTKSRPKASLSSPFTVSPRAQVSPIGVRSSVDTQLPSKAHR
jgi:hypothetical protein